MVYFTKYDYTIIRRHWIILLFKYLKNSLFLGLAWILYFISINYVGVIPNEIIYIFLLPSIFILVNYAFINLALGYIEFYNDLLIIHWWQLIVIKSTLLFKDDIEYIDVNKITKLDTFCRWFVPNILWYWSLVVEQQRDELRSFPFVPDPFKALKILKDEKDRTIASKID